MRLKNIYILLLKNKNVVLSVKSSSESAGTYIISGWPIIIKSLQELKQIKPLQSTIESIYRISPQITSYAQQISLTINQNNEFISQRRHLLDKMVAIIDLCESMNFEENPDGFDIKMPVPKDFIEFADNINQLKRFFQTCPIIKDQDANIELSKTDVGSFWMQFTIIGSAVAMVLKSLAKVAQEALKVRSYYLICERQKEALRTDVTRNDILEDVDKLYEKMIKASLDDSVKNLDDGDKKLTPEEKEGARQSIETLGKLMSKGLEIYSSIEAPSEIQTLFPEPKDQEKIELTPKLIKDKSESTDGSDKE